MTALYNEITASNSSLQIKDTQKRNEFNEKFRIEFLTLENKYKGVYRFIINERQYIIWSLESYDKLYEIHIKNTQKIIPVEVKLDIQKKQPISYLQSTTSSLPFSYSTSRPYLEPPTPPLTFQNQYMTPTKIPTIRVVPKSEAFIRTLSTFSFPPSSHQL